MLISKRLVERSVKFAFSVIVVLLLFFEAHIALAAQPLAARENRSAILADIDATIAKLNNKDISYDDAIVEITKIIPKPVNHPGYPRRPIEFLVGWNEGGASDNYVREIGVDAAKIIGQSFTFINMPGAQGDTAVAHSLTREPDGYTIVGVNGSQPVSQIFLDLPYKFTEDMVPIISNQGYGEAFFISKDSPFKTWDDIVKYAKENPGDLTVATVGPTTDDGLVIWAIMDHFGIDIVNFGYNNNGERSAAVLGGHIMVLADSLSTVISLLEAGNLKPVLYYGPKRYTDIDPDVPCFGDYSLNINLLRWRGIAGSTGFPEDIQEYLYQVFYAAQFLPHYQDFEKRTYLYFSQPWCLAPEELKVFWTNFYNEGMSMKEKFYK